MYLSRQVQPRKLCMKPEEPNYKYCENGACFQPKKKRKKNMQYYTKVTILT